MSNQKAYWDKVAPDKVFTTEFKIDVFSQYVPKTSTILDYGCGYGRTLIELSQNGYEMLHGVDFSEEMINRGRQLQFSADLQVIASGSLPYEDNSIDSVLLLAVLTCVPSDVEQELIMREIKRVLKPSGTIYINDFLLNSDERNQLRYEKYKGKFKNYGTFELAEGAIVRHHNEAWVSKITQNFETLHYEKIEFVTMNGNKSNGFVYMGRYAE
ncbi:class I SAM-dependent methyltransferase [Fusibacter ferrireducens]|uniref:Class I SAM-dependent methyltransferase n=1 Tax=Fusibacter ferrireducens TaxID=2785058 RepID=A0ABR9ZYN6_9FIRM|nr:class I SAM-dependent methyltransferase [Fusibacter ferrireducens]MBF4695573.1 class I SAM-dependent methyltransferase [Fusibacter ferrireducens]